MTLTELAIKRPSIIVVIFTVLGVLGLFSYSLLNYELLPKMSPPVITISTIYPGASPYEVENNVTKILEDAVSGLDKIDAIRSTSFEGMSLIIVEFKQSAKTDIVLQDATRKVGEIVATLPSGAKQPTLSKIAIDEVPVLRIGVTSQMDSRQFYQFMKDRVQPRISKVPGVAQVILSGGEEREIKVNLDIHKLKNYGLSLLQVTQGIKNANLDFPTGKIKDSDGQFVIRVAGKFSSIEDLRNLVVARSRQGGDVRLGDIAEVQDGVKDYTQLNRVNGVTSVGIQLLKQTDANAVNVSALVRAELIKLQNDFKDEGIVFDIAQDSSNFTLDAANAVKFDLVLAIFMVAIVMLLFLHSFRNSLIVLVAIPSSIISTMVFVYAMGFSLNLMTLLGLSLVIGILVDDSIVVLENIYHHLEKGEEKRAASLRGRNEIGFAALSITLVDVVVFLPLSLVGGIVGNIMREFALVIVGSTLMSLFVSFTITPVLASRFAKVERLTDRTLLGKFALGFEKLYHKFQEHYLVLLKWSLGHKRWVAFIAIALFFGSFTLPALGLIGFEFFSQTDRGEFSVTVELPPGANIEQTNQASLAVEKILSEMPEVKKVFTTVGVSADGFIGTSSNNVVQLNVALVPKTERKKSTTQVGLDIKEKIHEIPGLKVYVSPIGIFGAADQAPIQIAVTGTEMKAVQAGADTVKNLLERIDGTADVRLSAEAGKPEMQVEIDRAKMAQFGLSVAEVGAALRVALAGDDESKYRDGNNEYTIRIQLDEFDRSQTSDLGSITFMNNRGQQIELKQFANIFQSSGPSKLQRQDRINVLYVNSQIVNRPAGTIVQEFRGDLGKTKLPNGVSLVYLGQEKNQQEGFGSMGLAMLAGILFVYLIMVALYDSYVYPFVVLFSIPMAIIGAFVALAVTGKALSIFSMLGFLMLIGLVAKNAILLVDRTNQTKLEQGLSTYDALIEAGISRLRPILMTTLTMIFGMLPIALSKSAGGEWKTGLAWVLVGGLTSSMFLTLLLVPVVYMKVDEWKTKIPAFFKRPSGMFARFRKNGNGTNGASVNPVGELETFKAH
ncbi:MAG: efflux RND transporter permease subunit [Ignavibacteriales bacterium]|nr:efflux RND transporter permease subunit [Ignavibacteriales bacterium]